VNEPTIEEQFARLRDEYRRVRLGLRRSPYCALIVMDGTDAMTKQLVTDEPSE
jgi:hypothetical protein